MRIVQDKELAELLGISKEPIISEKVDHLHKRSPTIYPGTKMDIILETDTELSKLLDDLFSSFNTLVQFILEDNKGLPPDILFDFRDYGKVSNVAIYLDICRRQKHSTSYIYFDAPFIRYKRM